MGLKVLFQVHSCDCWPENLLLLHTAFFIDTWVSSWHSSWLAWENQREKNEEATLWPDAGYTLAMNYEVEPTLDETRIRIFALERMNSFKTTTVGLSPITHSGKELNSTFLDDSLTSLFHFPYFFIVAYFHHFPNKQPVFKSLSQFLQVQHPKSKQLSSLKLKLSRVKYEAMFNWKLIWNKIIHCEFCAFIITERVAVIASFYLSYFALHIYNFSSYLDNILICKVVSQNLDFCCNNCLQGIFS